MPQSAPVRIVLQRVTRSAVRVDGRVVGSTDEGLLILVGVAPTDTKDDVDRAVEKVSALRVFSDAEGHMNLSIVDVGGSALVVSQFTLLGDVRKGRRPSFTGAAPPEHAAPIVEAFVDAMRKAGIHTETGVFGASMEVELVNDGPVTILLEVNEQRVS